MTILETNVDDLNPQFFSYIIERLIKLGAQDAFFKPVLMKKGRFGFLLSVVCLDDLKEKIIEAVFDETTAFGLKINQTEHVGLDRDTKRIKTRYGLVRINVGRWQGKVKTISPEFDDCLKLALKKKIPLKMVFEEARKKLG
jgi:uncharacterized protein (DUF111 family)